uniref:Myosin_tail_1 domain-containing protein n=1 Tax=Steinernema glaseri TaxID=37863 RepID=A0A1I7YFN3_9BILA
MESFSISSGLDNSETAKRAVEALIYEKIQLEARLKDLELEKDAATSRCEVHLKELHEIRNEKETHRLEMESLRTENTELRGQLKKAEDEAQKAKELKSEISREYSLLRLNYESMEQELKEAERRIEVAAEEVKKLKGLRDSSSEEARKAREELNDCRLHLHTMTQEMERLQKSNEDLGKDLRTCKLLSQEMVMQLDLQVEDAMALKRAAQKERDDAKKKAADLEKRLLTTENQLQKLKCDLKEFEMAEGRLCHQIDELRGTVSNLQNENSELSQAWKEAHKRLKNYARFGDVVGSALADLKEGELELSTF